jgi:nitrite reductase (NADH) small subunit
MTSQDWIVVCRVDDIPVLGSRRVARPRGVDVAVFRTGGDQVFALLDRCPHKGGPLSQGIVFGTSVACPLHNWAIGLDDGCARSPDEGCTPRFACRVDGGQVLLDPVELATHAVDLAPPSTGPCASRGSVADATDQGEAPVAATESGCETA